MVDAILIPAHNEEVVMARTLTGLLKGLDEGVRVFVLCGRDDPKTGAEPSFDQIQNRLEEDRVSRRAQIYLRDLRRDAIIDYN